MPACVANRTQGVLTAAPSWLDFRQPVVDLKRGLRAPAGVVASQFLLPKDGVSKPGAAAEQSRRDLFFDTGRRRRRPHEVVVALDWTSFAADGQDTIVLSMVTGHRATPLLQDGGVLDAEG